MSSDREETSREYSYKQTLLSNGVPVTLAEKSARILDKEITSYEQGALYQRTKEEQEIINSAHTWMFASSAQFEK